METITKAAARRIAYAAHCLPQIELHTFVMELVKQMVLPITEEKLAQVTVVDLNNWFANQTKMTSVLEVDGLERARRYLCGEEKTDPTIPVPQLDIVGEIPGSLRVAVASNTGEMLDGHFGSCPRFLIYQVGLAAVHLVEVRSTQTLDKAKDKNAARVDLIRDCAILYVQSIGGPAAAKVVYAGVHPVKFPAGGAAREALTRLQTTLTSPPPWLAKILGVSANSSLARYLEAVEE
ncbi:MAG: dinitrogenase iron-molybdenum cofactor biosynthesis protein [Thioploca sp.]|nr:dinitrogenase iron-molybdenum cofactor biosynthesis protein [Thioploca sp.]